MMGMSVPNLMFFKRMTGNNDTAIVCNTPVSNYFWFHKIKLVYSVLNTKFIHYLPAFFPFYYIKIFNQLCFQISPCLPAAGWYKEKIEGEIQ